MKDISIKKVSLLCFAFVIYSFTSVLSKMASQNHFLSLKYIIFFGGSIITLGLYAILWQLVLSFMPLHKAYLCKSICIIIILAISNFIFGEALTINNILGAICILSGLAVLSWKE